MAEQPALSFGGLLRQLRAEAKLTQEELAEAAQLSPRSVSDLERGVNRTARKDTAGLLADALGLAEPARELFVAAARGRGPAEDVLKAREGRTPGPGHRAARSARGCPYRGLLPFGESDAEVFYGRERLAAELAAKLAARAADGGLVVVTGASGAGKSSLLRAGLLPILARGQQVPGSDRWPRIVMTPTKDPLTELAARLAALGGPDALAVRDGLARHPDQAHLAIRSAALAVDARRDEEPPTPGGDATRLVLIVDQFEQVFTLNPDHSGEATRQAFIAALCAAAATLVGPDLEAPALVVIAVRGDFWDRCAAVPELVSELQDGQFVVGPMTESELRVAITGPAEVAGLRIDPALTDTILGDLRVAGGDRSAGVLPLLSQAMALTWEQREGDRLTSRGYAQAGGVSHAVQTGADRVYEALPAGQQALAREVLRSMTVASRDGGFARRPVTRDDLYTGLPGAARSDIDAVLDAFAAERLAVLNDDRAQIAHDVLLRAWPLLRNWLEEDQASWILHGQLADAAAAWHDSHDDPSFLYRGAQLAALQQAVSRWSANPARYPALTGNQRGFLQASERAAARRVRRQRGFIAFLMILVIGLASVTAVAFQQRAAMITVRNQALTARDQAIASQISTKASQLMASDVSLAAQLDVVANQISPTPDSEAQLIDTTITPLSSRLTGPVDPVSSVAFSPDGKTLAAGSYDEKVWLWNVADPAHPARLGQPLTGPAFLVFSVAFSPDGKTLAASDGDDKIWLWNLADPAHPTRLGQPLTGGPTGITGPVSSLVAFSRNGKTLAASGFDDKVRLWNLADPAHPTRLGQLLTGPAGPISSVAFSPDGKTLAISSGEKVWLWNLADPAHPTRLGQPLTGPAGPVDSVAFSPDGKTLAAGSDDQTVWLWNLADPAHPTRLGQPLTGPAGPVSSVAFSPDGKTLAVGSGDDKIWLWNLADPAHPTRLGQPLTGPAAGVYSVAFSPDGKTLAAGSADGTIRLWNLPSNVLTGPAGGVGPVAFSPDGKTLAAGGGDGKVWLWNLADPAHPTRLGQPLTGPAGGTYSVAVSPDGKTLAAAGNDHKVWLWNLADPAHPARLGQPLTGPEIPVGSVAFSPDGRTLAAASADEIWLWNLANPAHPARLGQPLSSPVGYVNSVAFSPDGKTLAGGNAKVQVWDLADPAHPARLGQPLTGPAGSVYSVAFSRDGKTLAAAGDDHKVWLWNLADPAHPARLGQPLTGPASAVDSVTFSPDGKTLAATSGDEIWLWNLADSAHPAQPLTGPASGVGSVTFSPGGMTLATGGGDGTVEVWSLNVDDAIQRICAATSNILTPAQWKRYVPQLPYSPRCAHPGRYGLLVP